MAIRATQISNLGTVEQLRNQFNNLVTDVSGLESGTLNFGNISATVLSVGDLTVTGGFTIASIVGDSLTLNGSEIVFEGSTADANETTLFVTNPTADRTITFPDATGEVFLTGGNLDLGDGETFVGQT